VKKNILIVDDSRLSRALNKSLLVDMGHNVIDEAVDGLDGYEKYKALKPDLILSDIEMPNLDGLGLVKKIRATDNDTQIIIISSMANARVIEHLSRLGIAVVQKPITDERKLVAAIKKVDALTLKAKN